MSEAKIPTPPWQAQPTTEAKHTIPINSDTYLIILGIQAHESTKDKHGIPISEQSPAISVRNEADTL
ncbi:unnamed protein product [Penicillium camemberti]|uniref:Str. FM013 n=1 Tax=Penicillium camemberti (strain FM 013) TaxID=1429867 RepID=A0A0G4PVX9_PENC3|nr:unnamed protein product [Penicillium camemberti]